MRTFGFIMSWVINDFSCAKSLKTSCKLMVLLGLVDSIITSTSVISEHFGGNLDRVDCNFKKEIDFRIVKVKQSINTLSAMKIQYSNLYVYWCSVVRELCH